MLIAYTGGMLWTRIRRRWLCKKTGRWAAVRLRLLAAVVVVCFFSGNALFSAESPDSALPPRSFFEQVFNDVPLGVFAFGTDGTLFFANTTIAVLLESSVEKLEGLLLFSLPDAEVVDAVRQALGGEPARYLGEYTSVTSGAVRPIRAFFLPLFNEAGAVVGGFSVVEDMKDSPIFSRYVHTIRIGLAVFISVLLVLLLLLFRNLRRQKHMARSLETKAQELEYYFSSALDLLCIADTKGNFVRVNRAWEEILGYTARDLERKTFLEFVHPDDMAATLEAMKKLDQQEDILEFTNRYRRSDGEYRYIEWHSSPKGSLIYAAARDITERKNAEKAAEEWQHVMQHVIRHDPNSIAVLDKNLHFIFVSDRFRKDYRVENVDILGKHHYEVFPDIPETWREVHRRALQGEVLAEEESRFEREDGTVDWTRWECRPWYAMDGSIGGIVLYTEVITRRKQMEDTLKASNERLDLAMDAGEHGFWDWNLETNETFFSPAYYTMLGYENEAMPMHFETFETLLHPDDRDAVLPLVSESIKQGKPYEVEFRLRCRDGSWKWILGKGKSYESDASGKPRRAVGVHVDIDERKRSEEELRQSEQRAVAQRFAIAELTTAGYDLEDDARTYAAITELVSRTLHVCRVSIWLLSPDGTKLRCEDLYEREQRLHSRGEVVDTALTPNYFSTLDRETRVAAEDAQADERTLELKPHYLEPHGVASLLDSAIVVDRKLIGVLSCESINEQRRWHLDEQSFTGTVAAIIAQMHVARQRRETEQTITALFASMTEMVVMHELVFDAKGKAVNYRITDCNSAYSSVTGITREAAVGSLGTDVYGSAEPPYFEEFSRVALTGKPYHYETFYEPMNKYFSISVVSPGKNKFATITSDITEAKQVQQIIAAKNKELEQIVYVASHDLRSPLVNVDGYGREMEYSVAELREALEKKQDIGGVLEKTMPDITDSLQHIRSSTRQMDVLLKGLLTLSRSGRAALQIEPLDVDAIVRDVVANMDYQIGEAGAEILIDTLPSCRGDIVQITQVFGNLVSNALKYLVPERPGRIRITGAVQSGRAVYCVEDNGCGIAPEHQEYIFELFHRLEPAKTEGEGLGLTIIRQILSRLDGEIWLTSEPGAGSRFYVSLPFAKTKTKSKFQQNSLHR